jgi:hypothetical protein
LAQIYDKALALDTRNFEIILIGYDESAAKHEKYMAKSKIKWPAMTFDDKEKLEKVVTLGETGFLPNLVLVSKDGKVLTNDRKEVLAKLNGFVASAKPSGAE